MYEWHVSEALSKQQINGVESSRRQAYACQPIDRLNAGFSCGWPLLLR